MEQHGIKLIGIGNGTVSRETDQFITEALHDLPKNPVKVVVNQAGASVYSASKLAKEEFPDLDVTVRGAFSIARRLQDPLAELLKIDPKAIGVGQYQHDVDQTRLQNALDEVVISCVNAVGVEVNSSSSHLLTYVSGLGPQLAQNIVDYRTENGPFRSRQELLKVKRMGAKAFEQCAGFLRIRGAENPLDSSGRRGARRAHCHRHPCLRRGRRRQRRRKLLWEHAQRVSADPNDELAQKALTALSNAARADLSIRRQQSSELGDGEARRLLEDPDLAARVDAMLAGDK